MLLMLAPVMAQYPGPVRKVSECRPDGTLTANGSVPGSTIVPPCELGRVGPRFPE
jgi:hypothetical protein